MSIWTGNRFEKKEDLPPEGTYDSILKAVIPWKAKGPRSLIFLFGFEHQGKEYRAGKLMDALHYDYGFFELTMKLLGHPPRLGAQVKASELLGQPLRIDVVHDRSEQLRCFFLKVDKWA